ncbi:MAG TPA: hypothetical protein PKD72_06450 [Gemmatales bacterium]|nr:hypothetical protein [Gemmatales bacterium]
MGLIVFVEIGAPGTGKTGTTQYETLENTGRFPLQMGTRQEDARDFLKLAIVDIFFG